MVLFVLLGLSLVMIAVGYISHPSAVYGWEQFQELKKYPVPLHSFSVGGTTFTTEVSNYIVFNTWSTLPLQISLAALDIYFVFFLLGFSILITLLTLIALRRHRPKVRDQALSAWNTVSRKLSRRGLGREPHEGPRDYVARIAASLTPAQAAALGAIQSLYIRVRYASETSGSELAELKRAVKEFDV